MTTGGLDSICPHCGAQLRMSEDPDEILFCPTDDCEYNLQTDEEVEDEGFEYDDRGDLDEYYPSDSDETDKDLP